MGAAVSTRLLYDCVPGIGMCAAPKHGVLIMSHTSMNQLCMYSLFTGLLVRTVGCKGKDEEQFDIRRGCGGLCVTPNDDTVLVAEYCNSRIQEVRITDGLVVRSLFCNQLTAPQHVACNAEVIAVSDDCHYVTILSWSDGSPRAKFGAVRNYVPGERLVSVLGPSELYFPRGVCLLADGRGVAVADEGNDRLCVYRLTGEFWKSIGHMDEIRGPRDVLETRTDGSFVVCSQHCLAKISTTSDGTRMVMYGKRGWGRGGEFCCPSAIAALPNGGCAVRDAANYVQVLVDRHVRCVWMRACNYARH